MSKKLEDLTQEEFNELRNSGMLWEFHPESCQSWFATQQKLKRGEPVRSEQYKKRQKIMRGEV